MSESEQADLARVFADIARQLEAETSQETTQDRVTQAAVATVEGCDHAAISLIRRRGGIETVAATDDVPQRVDTIQYDIGQGPCLDAMAEHDIVMIDDLAADGRWPVFSRRAVEETGVRPSRRLRDAREGLAAEGAAYTSCGTADSRSARAGRRGLHRCRAEAAVAARRRIRPDHR